MRNPACMLAFLGAAIPLVILAPRAANAQDPRALPADILLEKFYELRLLRDQKRLQNDIGQGDTVSVNRDLNRIQMDEWNIMRRHRQTRRDMWLPAGPRVPRPSPIPLEATLVPHPQYPGYGYYPSNPAQLYQLAQPGAAPGATTAPAQVSVVIVNSQPSGAAASYIVDGVAYKTESGQKQQLIAGPASTILYDRGGALGERRYALSAGVYEFQSSEQGLALFKLPPMPQESASQNSGADVPKNVIPAAAGAPSAVEAGSSSPGVRR